MTHKVSDEIIQALITKYTNGLTATELAEEFNICRETVVKYLKLHNVFKPKTHNWSKEMDEKLKEIYPTRDWDLILQTFPGRSKSFIYVQASKLGLRMDNYFWSQHDEDILKKYYNIIPTTEIQAMLEGEYKIRAIQCKARKMGLTKSQLWTNDEMKIMKEKYPSLGAKDIMEFLPNKTYAAIIGKAVAMGLRCDFFWTEEEVAFLCDNYLNMSDEELASHLNRKVQSIKDKRWSMGLLYPKMDRKYYDITDYIRHNNENWKKASMKNCNYKCIFTNDTDFEIHHLYSFNLILKETMQDDRWINKDIKEYSDIEIKNMLSIFNEYQDKYPLGVCVSKEIHKLFHLIYGNRYNTVEQWNKFEEDYKKGLYKTSITD